MSGWLPTGTTLTVQYGWVGLGYGLVCTRNGLVWVQFGFGLDTLAGWQCRPHLF